MEKEQFNEKSLCRRCHRKLKDDKSKQLGFGPTCYKKYINRKKSYLFSLGGSDEAIIK